VCGAAEAAIAFTSQEEVVFGVLHELIGQAEWLRNYVVLFCRMQARARPARRRSPAAPRLAAQPEAQVQPCEHARCLRPQCRNAVDRAVACAPARRGPGRAPEPRRAPGSQEPADRADRAPPRAQADAYMKAGNALHSSSNVPTMPDFAPSELPAGLPPAASADLGPSQSPPAATPQARATPAAGGPPPSWRYPGAARLTRPACSVRDACCAVKPALGAGAGLWQRQSSQQPLCWWSITHCHPPTS